MGKIISEDGNGGTTFKIELPNIKPSYTRIGLSTIIGIVLTAILFMLQVVFNSGGKVERLDTYVIQCQENAESIAQLEESIVDHEIRIAGIGLQMESINDKLDAIISGLNLAYMPEK